MRQLFIELQKPDAFLFCGNTVTDPLRFLLSYGAPLAGISVVAIAHEVYRNRARAWSAWAGGFITLTVTTALVVFGVWLFRNWLGGAWPLSSEVWWLRPFGLIGI